MLDLGEDEEVVGEVMDLSDSEEVFTDKKAQQMGEKDKPQKKDKPQREKKKESGNDPKPEIKKKQKKKKENKTSIDTKTFKSGERKLYHSSIYGITYRKAIRAGKSKDKAKEKARKVAADQCLKKFGH